MAMAADRVAADGFEQAVDRRAGSYQLLPVTSAGVLAGNSPETIILRTGARGDQRNGA